MNSEMKDATCPRCHNRNAYAWRVWFFWVVNCHRCGKPTMVAQLKEKEQEKHATNIR